MTTETTGRALENDVLPLSEFEIVTAQNYHLLAENCRLLFDKQTDLPGNKIIATMGTRPIENHVLAN
jgi:hypothetical protein